MLNVCNYYYTRQHMAQRGMCLAQYMYMLIHMGVWVCVCLSLSVSVSAFVTCVSTCHRAVRVLFKYILLCMYYICVCVSVSLCLSL